MGRPINKKFIGKSTDGVPKIVLDSAFIPGSKVSSINVTILKQKGTGRYEVTDGTVTGIVYLVDGSSDLEEGQAIMSASVVTDQTSTTYTPTSITLNDGGSGYSINDVLTIPNAGTAKVLTVSESSNSITSSTSTLLTTSSTTDMAGSNLELTGGTGSGAEYSATSKTETVYTPASITLNAAGSGYATNDVITIQNVGTVTVTTVDGSGAITAITSTLSTTPESTDMAGTGISGTGGKGTGATFNVTSTSSTVYVPDTLTLTNNGTGYSVNDVLTAPNVGTIKVTAVDTSNAGTILTISTTLGASKPVNMSGTGISGTGGKGTGATFDVVSTKTTSEIDKGEHVRVLFDNTVSTFEGGVYRWNINGSTTPGDANLNITTNS